MARVLIIEPEPDMRSLAEQALLELGHEPVVCDDHAQHEPVDVVILATFDGAAAVAHELRRRLDDVPIICLDTRPAGNSARAIAPVAHLIEPYTLAQLRAVLDQALDRGAQR
jgi:CheY-like chemotaxis protein